MVKVTDFLLLLLSFSLAIVNCKPSTPPSFFNQNERFTGDRISNIKDKINRLPLIAPKNENIANEDHIEYMQKRSLQRAIQPSSASNFSNSSISNSNDKAQSIGLLDFAYYAPLNISKQNPQTVFVQLDTGSADLWIVSNSCQSQQCLTDKILKFNENESLSFQFLQLNKTSSNSSTDGDNENGEGKNVTISSQSPQVTSNVTEEESIVSNLVHQQSKVVLASQTGNEIPFSVIYDDGTAATGSLASDFITLSNLESPNQVFGLVNNTNVTLQSQGISGVLGMGFSRGSAIARSLIGENVNASTSPPLMNILSNHNNSYPLFSLLLNQTGGILTLGAADPEILSSNEEIGQVEWFDVIPFPSGNTAQSINATVNQDAEALGSYLYWALELSAVGYDGQSVNVSATYNQTNLNSLALLDSGAPGIVGPIDQVTALFDEIEGARHVGNGRFVVPCDTQGRMYFSFGGRNYTLLPTDYMIGRAIGNPYLCLSWPAASQASSDGIDWVLGQPFLRSQYSLYSFGIINRESPKIGLYPLRAEASSTDNSTIFQNENQQNISSFLSIQTPIATTLPNSLVPLNEPSTTPAYVFENATISPSIGLIPTTNAATLTISPILTAITGDTKLPILSNPISNLPVPSNPAQQDSNNGVKERSIISHYFYLGIAILASSFISFT